MKRIEPCFALHEDACGRAACSALRVNPAKYCRQCGFYKTALERQQSQKKADERLAKLPKKDWDKIQQTYYADEMLPPKDERIETNYTAWSQEEEEDLRQMIAEHRSYDDMAITLDRQITHIKGKIKRIYGTTMLEKVWRMERNEEHDGNEADLP